MMEALPRVAVVVPILNEVRYIRAAMDSLLAQDGIALDVIVYDAGSTDGTLEALAGYPVQVLVVPGLGQMAAINRGWQATSAEFVTWMAGDDRYKLGALRRLAQALRAHPAVAAAHAQAEVIDESGRVTALLAPGDVQLRDLVFEFTLVPQTALIRRAALERSGWFDEQRRLAADHDLFLRLAQYQPLHYEPFVAAEYRVHAGSEDARSLKQVGTESIDVVKHFFARPDLSPAQAAWRRRGLAGAHLFAGTTCCLAGDRRAGWPYWRQALRLHPPALLTRRGLGLVLRLLLPVQPGRYQLRGLPGRLRQTLLPRGGPRV